MLIMDGDSKKHIYLDYLKINTKVLSSGFQENLKEISMRLW